MKALAAAVLACLLAALAQAVLAPAARADSVTFAVFGDMPYELPDDYARFDAVIDAINRAGPDFAVHVGDFKDGRSPCTDEAFQDILNRFGKLRMPLVYTPGDNEWTDCHRESTGRMDPLERLTKLRSMFFPPETSLGQAPMAVERQSRAGNPAFARYAENARWQMAGVSFATLHVVGSNDNLQRNAEMAAEHFDRLAANLNWLAETFARARADDAPAVVLFMQANLGFGKAWEERTGYNELIAALARHAADWDRPVLLVHGDTHAFRIDKPLLGGRVSAPGLTRLEVFGSPHLHFVLVHADTERPDVFSFEPVIVAGGTR